MSNTIDISLHDKQAEAFFSPATEMLYGGAAGGGKSHLMRCAAITWCTEIDGLQVYLLRRLSDDLYKNHMEGAGGFFSLLANWFRQGLVKFNASKNVLTFFNGSKIWLSHCQHEKDILKFQGVEIHLLLIDELTHFSEKMYRFIRSRCRIGELKLPNKYEGLFPRIITGSNPGSAGHSWVKRTFVDYAPFKHLTRTPKEEGGFVRQYIPALLSDNPSQDDSYAETLSGLGSPELVKAMLEGSWDIVMGGAIDDLWRKDIHVVPRFAIPSNWKLDRSFDWGSSHPFSVGWWAESNGEEVVMPDGSIKCFPKGSLIRIHEWYGTEQIGTNKGLKLGSSQVAQGIVDIEKDLREGRWITSPVRPGAADNQIRDVSDADTDTIEKKMAAKGVRWIKSDKSAGSRKQGLELFRERLRASLDGEGKGIYFMEHCLGSIATLPILPRDEKKPDDVDTNSEDHIYDEVRYRILSSRKDYATNLGIRQAH